MSSLAIQSGCHHCYRLREPVEERLVAEGIDRLEIMKRLQEVRCPEHEAEHIERIKKDRRNHKAWLRRHS